MILEVNNTFDERRMYFLKGFSQTTFEPAHQDDVPVQTHEAQPGGVTSDAQRDTRFADCWSKDFHVSPFNSRKGSYTLSAHDPLSDRKIDNTITLSSSKGHPKLVARIFSTGDSINPSDMGNLDVLKFVAVWWWVGFVTFPRIVREAAKLFFRLKLHVWYRPEVIRGSIGRRGTEGEKFVTVPAIEMTR